MIANFEAYWYLSTVIDKIYGIKISDSYEKGFENIKEEGEKNPFNMAHVKDSHNNDEETSEFGMGLKLASIFF